ncbi:hypothetical protein V5O48_003626 [Marasmius crinis-equi]|uniref:DUF1793-domain-containing protein n=1 Tax=Marasmius crinis-equi TaxID=585013 RepID=A0ABR3FSD0_9AGAR
MFADNLLPLFTLLLSLLISAADCQFTSPRNFYPAAYPLAVRSPYLNAWISTRNDTKSLAQSWIYHWDDKSVMAWEGLVRVDGTAFRWLGKSNHGNQTTLLTSEITPTRSKFTISAGLVQLNVTFLSPIEPSDWVLQSLPFVYLTVDVISTDGEPHDVQLYSDVSGEWLSGDRDSTISWGSTTSDKTIYHQAARLQTRSMTEINNVAEDSTLYFGTTASSSSTWRIGTDTDVRGAFVANGTLTNTKDSQFRAIKQRWPVFAHAFDLGNVTNSPSSTVLSFGLIRDPVITYSTGVNSRNRSPYYRSRWNDMGEVVNFFTQDYENATKRADELDQKIMKDASAISNNYADLVALSARQAMAGIDITIAKGTDDQWNMSDVKAFMKDTGVSQRINPVEGIFAAFPMYLYLNSSLGGLLLDPLLEYQSGGSNAAAVPDLGGSYPQSVGDSSTLTMGVESTGNMLIAALAHAQRSGDGTLIGRYYDLFARWADYLNSNALHPKDQVSADTVNGDDLSNLAVKGIIGIAAMARISQAVGRDDDSKGYAAKAADLYSQWARLAISEGHVVSTYNNSRNTPLVYNLYADVLLQTKAIDDSVYNNQTSFYERLTPGAPRFGLPYDGIPNTPQASAPWTIFTAATVTQNSTRDKLIDMVHARATYNETSGDFATYYSPDTGEVFANYGQASPAQGAMFALLAQSLPIQTIVVPESLFPGAVRKTTSNAGTIAGAVIGTFAGLGLVLVAFLYWRRKQQVARDNALKPVPFNPNLLYRQRDPAAVAMNSRYHDAHLPQHYGQNAPLLDRQSPVPATDEPTETMSPTSHSHNPSQTMSETYSQGGASTMYTTDTTQLRAEIANLRAQMQDLQAHEEISTPPPGYDNPP